MKILLAFDKFKHAMSAHQACLCAYKALKDDHPEYEIQEMPLSDGGGGFCEIMTHAACGKLIETSVAGPLGSPVLAKFGLVQGQSIPLSLGKVFKIEADETLGIIEMAQASGLGLVPPNANNPHLSTSRGTGELMLQAKQAGAQALVLGIGDSASNDLGLGALEALGLHISYKDGQDKGCIRPQHWDAISAIDGQALQALPPLFIASDVNNPLLGTQGATRVYGPQKGIHEAADINFFENHLSHLAKQLCKTFNRDGTIIDEAGSGAAGGIACGLRIAYGARRISGFELVAQWLGLAEKIAWADLIVTGEGRFDKGSLQGKGPGSILEMAQRHGKPVEIFTGCTETGIEKCLSEQVRLHCITPKEMGIKTALREAQQNLSLSIKQHFQGK